MTKITVFTPAYNRLSTLDRLYQSLKNQTCYDFEWLVVDDGSQDETDTFFENIIKNNDNFKIRYLKVKNGGKHRAINLGLDKANGEFFFIVDSDDYLVNNCIELIIKWFGDISKLEGKYAGVSGLKGYNPNKYIGKTFKGNHVDCTSLDREKNNICGDKAEIFRTEILRKYKFPEIPNEKFVTEALVWNRIASDGYLIRWYNKIIYICEYRSDGLSSQVDSLLCRNYKGYTLYVQELLRYNISFKTKLITILQYAYRGRMKGISYKNLSNNLSLPILFLCVADCLASVSKNVRNLFKNLKARMD